MAKVSKSWNTFTVSPHCGRAGRALTVLQRRLASSTHAILRALQRRRERLETKRREMLDPRFSRMDGGVPSYPREGRRTSTASIRLTSRLRSEPEC
jgi:hypothetical protein